MSGKLTIYVYFFDNHIDYNVDYYIDYYVDHGFDGLRLVEVVVALLVGRLLFVDGWLQQILPGRPTIPVFPPFGYFYIYTRNFFVHIDQTINIIYIIYSVLMIPRLIIAGPKLFTHAKNWLLGQ